MSLAFQSPCSTLCISARARLYLYPQYGNTHAAFAYFGKSTVPHTVAVVDSQQIIFFANRQNFSLKMFAGSVTLILLSGGHQLTECTVLLLDWDVNWDRVLFLDSRLTLSQFLSHTYTHSHLHTPGHAKRIQGCSDAMS